MPNQPAIVQPDTIFSAVLLAATGGLLDAVVYINHGHVFANAMTGNIVLLGISAFSHEYLQAVRHLVPLLGFAVGVSASRLLRNARSPHLAIIALSVEFVTLLIVGFLPAAFPAMPFTAIIAFVSAFQIATFRTVGRFLYNSTFITGNLREVFEGFAGYLLPSGSSARNPAAAEHRQRDLAKSRKLALICLLFLAGAMLGAWAAPRLGNRSFWLAEPLLLLVAARILPRLIRLNKEA